MYNHKIIVYRGRIQKVNLGLGFKERLFTPSKGFICLKKDKSAKKYNPCNEKTCKAGSFIFPMKQRCIINFQS